MTQFRLLLPPLQGARSQRGVPVSDEARLREGHPVHGLGLVMKCDLPRLLGDLRLRSNKPCWLR